jgi:hypothetical protein
MADLYTGVCPACGQLRALKNNGKLRHHRGAPGSAPRGSGTPALASSTRAYRCPGSDRLPVVLHQLVNVKGT